MTDYNDLDHHVLNQVFPVMDDGDLELLGKDIKENGLRHAITLYEGQILDGKNRYLAARRAGVNLAADDFVTFDGDWDGAKLYVINMNLNRRSLTPTQRAHVEAVHTQMRADRAAILDGADRARAAGN